MPLVRITAAAKPCRRLSLPPRDPLQGRAIADLAAKTLGLHKVATFNEFGSADKLGTVDRRDPFVLQRRR